MIHGNIKDQLEAIRRAYNESVDHYRQGLADTDFLPDKFANSAEFKKFRKRRHDCHSGELGIKNYLDPKTGMNFLDVGSCLNLMSHCLYSWPSTYYGIDISPKLIEVSGNFVSRHGIKIGGLCVAEVAKIPFHRGFFDIAAAIGVLEYFDISYIKKAIKELHRTLKSAGKLAVDMPNADHPDFKTMVQMETYLGRPRFHLPARAEFEEEIRKFFVMDSIKDDSLMIKYFLRKKKK